MARLICLSNTKQSPDFVRFERGEIARLLALYAVRVAGGEWRDYAIDVRPDGAVFSVFRHTLDRPLYTITKAPPQRRGAAWTISSPGRRSVLRYGSLDEALAALDRTPHIVPS